MASTQRALYIVKRCVLALGVFNVFLSILSKSLPHASQKHYSFIGNDVPGTLEVPGVENPVQLIVEDTVHFPLNGTLARQEWWSLIPPLSLEDGLVHLGPEYRPFAVAMLHTFHCINRIRARLVNIPHTPQTRAHVEHCFNYMRQSVLCAADTTLEPLSETYMEAYGVQNIDGLETNVKHVCRDWSAVYREVERNSAEWDKSGYRVVA